MQLAFRPYDAADFEFAFQVGKAAMGAYVVRQFGIPWVDDEHRRHLADSIGSAQLRIVLVDGGDEVGITSHEWLPGHLALNKLYLLPRVHNRGIGSAILRQYIDEAGSRGLPIRLRVLRVNPARRLYERHGFEVVEEQPERFIMERRP